MRKALRPDRRQTVLLADESVAGGTRRRCASTDRTAAAADPSTLPGAVHWQIRGAFSR
jgi:hypothetical protein